MNVGFVGLGVMGAPMARNVLCKGFPLRVFDIDPARPEALAAAGALAVPRLTELSPWAEAVILMLPGPRAIREVALRVAAAAAPGTVIVHMTASDPALDQELAAGLEGQGIRWLHTPVSRAVPAAIAGTLMTMVGGDAQVLVRCRPVLAAMASDIVHVGPTGSGHAMKLLNNLKIMAEVALMAEGVALGVRGGIPAEVMHTVLARGSVDSFMWRYQVPRMAAEDFTPGFSVDHGHQDLSLASTWAERLGMPLPMGKAALAVFHAGRRGGRGAQDTAALVKLYGA